MTLTHAERQRLKQQVNDAVDLLLDNYLKPSVDEFCNGDQNVRLYLVGMLGKSLILNGMTLYGNAIGLDHKHGLEEPYELVEDYYLNAVNEERALQGLPPLEGPPETL